jgi:2-aminoadipate transaminase
VVTVTPFKLGEGLPCKDLFPRQALAGALLRALSEPPSALTEGDKNAGDPQLREWIADRLRGRGAKVSSEDVIVTRGAQQALALAVERLCHKGSLVGLDRESYPQAIDLFRAAGGRPVPQTAGADLIYAMPGATNPSGAGMTEVERQAILQLGAPIIADEACAELRFDGQTPRPLLADARERTWHLGTFSKTMCPGLQVGWLIPPPTELQAVLWSKREASRDADDLAQLVVRHFLSRDDFESRLSRIRRFYSRRAARFADCIHRRLPSWTFREAEGGFSLFLETDLEGDELSFLECCLAHGVSFDPGALFRTWERGSYAALRVSYTGILEEEFDEAVRCLARAASDFTNAAVVP